MVNDNPSSSQTRQSQLDLFSARPAPPSNSEWRTALLRMEGAYSANTIRSYRSDFEIFLGWCLEAHRDALPASSHTVAEFIKAQSKSATPATISRRRAAIGKIHRLLNLENPARAEDVILAERTVLRQKGRRQKQALGLTDVLKRRLIAACSNDLHGLRDRALIATGYDSLCRRSELVALRIPDLTVDRDGSGVVLVRKSKADQFGAGRLAYLSSETVTLLNRWLEAAQIDDGPIFRRIRGQYVEEGELHPCIVASIIRLRATEAQLEQAQITKLAGHSMRVGAAQDMAAAGIELGAIMHAGGWKSPEMVMRYIEHMDVGKSGMARLYSKLTR